ncbi:hypothetical protein JCM5350_007148 [Sporobolomyces pararoseus]
MVKQTPQKPSTLDTFIRPTPSPSTSSTLKRPSTSSSTTTTSTSQKTKKQKKTIPNSKNGTTTVVVKKKRIAKRKPLLQDNRNLGTLELLDTTTDDEDQDQDVTSTTPRTKDKGKGNMVLEEEDWMLSNDDFITTTTTNSLNEKQRGERVEEEVGGNEKEEKRTKEKVFGRWKEIQPQTTIGSTSKTIVLDDDDEEEVITTVVAVEDNQKQKEKVNGKGKEKETIIQLSSDEDEENKETIDKGLICPMCKLDLKSLHLKKRNSHVASCLDTMNSRAASTTTTTDSKPSLLQRGLLAPISRLFSSSSSRQPTPSTSSSTSTTTTTSSSSKPLTSRLPNAFTALMSGHLESTQWKEADQSALQKGRLPKGESRKVPFYKWIDGMQVTVDAFRYGKIEGCKGYFLSHAHSDHYQNLSSSWQWGPIYCSLTTANLIKLKLNVDDKWVIPLPMNETVKVQGIDVTLIDANHCPGSVLFLFEGPHTDPSSPYSKTPSRIFRHLHCGDFRASPSHILHPSLSFPHPAPPSLASLLPEELKGRNPKKLDSIYLDTTYLSPSYCFPAQELVIKACADLVKERVVEGNEEALWRADGREGERIGIKGWLNRTGGVKEEVKDEEGEQEEDEKMELEMLETLPEEKEEEEESMATNLEVEEEDGYEGEEDDDGEEEWKMIREMESRVGTIEPENGYLETGVVDGNESKGLEEVPQGPLEQAEQDAEFEMDHKIEPEEKMEEDSKVELKPKLENAAEEEKPIIKVDEEIKPDIRDEKPDVKPKTERLLVMIGTYSIGKERIVKAIAHALSTKIYADPRKKELFLAQDDADLHSLLTDDPLEAQVHVGWLSSIARDEMLEYLAKYKAPRCEGGFNKMIGLRPTGWTYRSESKDKFPSIPKILQLEQSRKFSPAGLYPQRDSTPQCMAFGVPYSEHSSFFELTCFCLSLDYVRIIPTVNVHNPNSRNKMKEWIDRWAAEKKRRQDARMPKVVPFRNENYW